MRKDFKKVLCEEPRRKGWGSNGKSLNKLKGSNKRFQNDTKGDYEDWSLPCKETMFGKRGRGTKEFGEHLQPLVRFLRSSVGRPWNDVFSEIRERCPNDNAVNAHIYQHLWGYVERYAQIIDGEVYHSPDYSFGRDPRPLLDHGRDNTFYVDDKGILRRAPRFVRTKREKENNVFKHQGKIYVRQNGIWFKTALKPLGKPVRHVEMVTGYGGRIYQKETWRYPEFQDVYLGVSSVTLGYDGRKGAQECERTYGKKVYCWQLRQLNTRELKKLGLKE